MKTERAILAATAVSLLLGSRSLTAGELPFNAPSTARAQESGQLLHQAAQALRDLQATSPLPLQRRQISNLWLYPTADADTVFAQYDLNSSHENGPSAKHLTVLTIRGNRILVRKELTEARTESVFDHGRPAAGPHWSAFIGTGHVSSADAAISARGVPASPHWSARVGTGVSAASASATESERPSSSNRPSAVVDAHWTSRIATGHVAASNARARAPT